jgi:hypothetical protein
VTSNDFEHLIERQTELIAALDAGDADAIIAVSANMAAILRTIRDDAAKCNPKHIEQGLKLAEAARIRVNYLTAWNRQKIDRLAQLRGQATGTTYAKPRFSCA